MDVRRHPRKKTNRHTSAGVGRRSIRATSRPTKPRHGVVPFGRSGAHRGGLRWPQHRGRPASAEAPGEAGVRAESGGTADGFCMGTSEEIRTIFPTGSFPKRVP